MGKQSRLRAERRELPRIDTPLNGEPLRILRSVMRDIEKTTFALPRQCWDYLVEMMAHASGWKTDTNESGFLWDKIPTAEARLVDYCRVWNAEVEAAKNRGAPFSEPLGDLLMEAGADNKDFDQFMTPMEVVRATSLASIPPEGDPGQGMLTGMDPCCGTGRFVIDALVHNEHMMMRGVEIDLSLMRAAMVNLRYLARFTSLTIDKSKVGAISPFDEAAEETLRQQGVHKPRDDGSVRIVGGRGLFMHADALIADLTRDVNWTTGAWSWKPHRWQANLLIDPRFEFFGTWDQYQDANRIASQKAVPDFSMHTGVRK